jgi:hypothetical protein
MKPSKTESGNVAFKTRSALMSVRQRALFLLCDGNRTTDAILAATAALGAARTDLDHLIAHGFLAMVEPPVPVLQPTPVALAAPSDAAPTVQPEGKRQDRSLYVENWTMF